MHGPTRQGKPIGWLQTPDQNAPCQQQCRAGESRHGQERAAEGVGDLRLHGFALGLVQRDQHMRLRPSASPSRPSIGAAMVLAGRQETTTPEICSTLPGAPAIAGSAVETMVWSSAGRNIGSMINEKT